MRWRGVKCPSCGCTGTGPPDAATCDCGACVPPAQITVNSLTVYRATGSNISCNLVNNAVSIGTGLVLTRDVDLATPPCIASPVDVEGCWYGPASDSSHDLTSWGGKAGSGCNLSRGATWCNRYLTLITLGSISTVRRFGQGQAFSRCCHLLEQTTAGE